MNGVGDNGWNIAEAGTNHAKKQPSRHHIDANQQQARDGQQRLGPRHLAENQKDDGDQQQGMGRHKGIAKGHTQRMQGIGQSHLPNDTLGRGQCGAAIIDETCDPLPNNEADGQMR